MEAAAVILCRLSSAMSLARRRRDEEAPAEGTAPVSIIVGAAAATAPEEEAAAVGQDPACALAQSRIMPDSSAAADADADAAAALLAARPLLNDVANGAEEGCDALICDPDTCMRPGERHGIANMAGTDSVGSIDASCASAAGGGEALDGRAGVRRF